MGISCQLSYYCSSQDAQLDKTVDDLLNQKVSIEISSIMNASSVYVKIPYWYQVNLSMSYDSGIWCLQQYNITVKFYIVGKAMPIAYSFGNSFGKVYNIL